MSLRILFFQCLIFTCINLECKAQCISFSGKLRSELSNYYGANKLKTIVEISRKSIDSTLTFSESQSISIGSNGDYKVIVGKGKPIYNNIDSINWSDGSYYLVIRLDTSVNKQSISILAENLRVPSDLQSQHIEGFVTDDSLRGFGLVSIPNLYNKKPKKIILDLTTSYVNLAYPADKYPIYRHYEWHDEDLNGLGNSFMLTYSEKTFHEFWIDSKKIGEVKLYEKPFQEMIIQKNSNDFIEILLTKPFPVDNLNVTYAIKAPWKMIYFIEW
jgi:hypothetical protein